MAKQNEAGLITFINKQRRTNHKDFQNCLFACFLSQMEPKKEFCSNSSFNQSIIVPISTARQSSTRAATPVSAARPINTAASKPLGLMLLSPQHAGLGDQKLMYKIMSPKTVDHTFVSDLTMLIQKADSSQHMTGNISYLTDFREHDGGYVAFGGGAKGGKITRKGTIRIADESQVLLKVHRKNNMYSCDMKNIVPQMDLTYLLTKATNDELMLWHRRLGHINFKNIDKLVKDNLVRGLPSKCFENDQTCVAYLKGKQHKVSFKSKLQNSISQPLFMLHMDLFGPTSVSSIMHKKYCLVIIDDLSRFTWVFFLARKDETSSVARTPQQNKVAERRNRKLIEATRTMLADSKLPTTFWADAVNTACYIQNKVLVVKPHFKTPYELFKGSRPEWLFNIDALSKSMSYAPVLVVNNATPTYADYPNDPLMPDLEDAGILDDAYDDRDEGAEADYNNLETIISVEPKKVTQALDDESWVEAMQEELLYTIEEEVYVIQPSGFVDPEFPDRVYKVEKALYGLHQTPRAWPKIMFVVCACSRFQVQSKVSHMHAVKRIFKYLKSQPKLGHWYPKDSPLELIAYSNSDYAGASLDRKSTTGGCQFLGSMLISWQCKKQTIMANFTTEAEYIVASNCCRHVLWLQNQLLDYGYNFMQTKIHVDNESLICMVKNYVYHLKTKHIEIRHHFIIDSYKKRLIEMVKIHTDYNVADLLTKDFDVTSTKPVNTPELVNNATPTYVAYPNDPLMPDLEDAGILDDAYDDRDKGTEADYNNLETIISISPILST
nr:putative ribonuclease H-like domain-containing protein [Tanacetum cinerariifolium]